MLGIRRVEKIRNKDIKISVRVVNVREKMREKKVTMVGTYRKERKGSGEESMDTESTRKEA